MAQRDVMLRWIEQIALVVRRMLLGPGPPDLRLVRIQVEDAMTQLLGPLATLVPRLDPASAAALLQDPERIQGLALLLELEGEVAAAEGNLAAAEAARTRAAQIRSYQRKDEET